MARNSLRKKRNPNYNFRQPCLGFFLQGGVKALSVMDVGIQMAMIIVLSFGIKAVWNDWMTGCQNSQSNNQNMAKCGLRPIHWWYYYTYNVISIFLSKQLFVAAAQRDLHNLMSWLLTSVVLYIPWLAFYISHTIWIVWAHEMGAAAFGGFGGYKLYSFWVVWSYIKEVRHYSPINFAFSKLSDEEIQEFFEGRPTVPNDQEEHADILDKPYPQNTYEIKDPIILGQILGRGAFGEVRKAKLIPRRNSRISNFPCFEVNYINVAVKQVLDNAEPAYIKALLSELKILTHVGRHEHIVSLVGAVTSQIKDKKLLIVVEFCSYGSMINYLRANRGRFVDRFQLDALNASMVEGNRSLYIPRDDEEGGPTTTDLIKWAMQTASGMEYISSKRVIHGDLAARNVLLDSEKNVKIADFGLSHQLYQLSVYEFSKEKPLPWRWTAIEALVHPKYTTMSDIWSYGITIYEYFTCGALPFSSWSYCSEFVDLLKTGQLVPEKPAYASDTIYAKLLQCLSLDPEKRPSFRELKQFFLNLLDPSECTEYLPVINSRNSTTDNNVTSKDVSCSTISSRQPYLYSQD